MREVRKQLGLEAASVHLRQHAVFKRCREKFRVILNNNEKIEGNKLLSHKRQMSECVYVCTHMGGGNGYFSARTHLPVCE